MDEHVIDAMAGRLTDLGARTVVVGCSRDVEQQACANDFIAAWQRPHGVVLRVVDWPEHAASWLRQARQLVAGGPDGWVLFARPAGFLGLARRLAAEPGWAVDRAVCGPTLEDERLLAEPALAGLGGIRSDGSPWRLGRGVIVRDGCQERCESAKAAQAAASSACSTGRT